MKNEYLTVYEWKSYVSERNIYGLKRLFSYNWIIFPNINPKCLHMCPSIISRLRTDNLLVQIEGIWRMFKKKRFYNKEIDINTTNVGDWKGDAKEAICYRLTY